MDLVVGTPLALSIVEITAAHHPLDIKEFARNLGVNHDWLKDAKFTIVANPRISLYSVAETSLQSLIVEITAACHHSAPVRLAD